MDELRKVYNECLNVTNDGLERDLEYDEAMNVQKHLIVLFSLEALAQRKQVCTYFIVNDLQWNAKENYYMYLPSIEKKNRPQASEGFPLPKYFGDLLLKFEKIIRPKLLKRGKPNPKTFWINSEGAPTSIL